MKIFYYPRFKDSYHKLPLAIQKKAEKREQLLRKDHLDRRLKVHKLHGKLKHLWSFSIDDRYRVIFEFDGPDIIFLDVGDHDVYR